MDGTREGTALEHGDTAAALARYRGRAVRWAAVNLLVVLAGVAGGTIADAAGWSWFSQAAVWAVGGGLVFEMISFGALVNSRRMRRTLRSGPWVACAAEGFAPGNGYPSVVLKDPASGALRPLVTAVLRHRYPLAQPGPERMMWWCGRPDGRGVLARPGCPDLLWARPPHTRRVWRDRLHAAEQRGLPARSAPAQPQPAAPRRQEASEAAPAAGSLRRHRGLFRWVALLGVVAAGTGLAGYLASRQDPEVGVVILATHPDGTCTAGWVDPWSGGNHTGPFACHAEDGEMYTVGWVVSYGPWKGDLYNSRWEGTPALDVNDALGEVGLPLALVGLAGGAVRHLVRGLRGRGEPLTRVPHAQRLPQGPPSLPGDAPAAGLGYAELSAAAERQAPARSGPPPQEADVRRVPWWRVAALRKGSDIVPASALLVAAAALVVLVTGGVLDTGAVWPGGVPGAAALVVTVWRAARTGVPTARALAHAARSPVVHRKRYALFSATPDDVPLMLLFPATDAVHSRPDALLPVRLPGPRSDRTAGLPAPVGTCAVHGSLHKHAAAVPWVEGRPLWPLGGLVPIDPRDPADEALLRQLAGSDLQESPHDPVSR